MDAVNWLLLNVGFAVRWCGAEIAGFFSAAGRFLDALLNPVLAPILGVLNPLSTSVGDGIYALLNPLPAWCGITVISIVTGMIMLLAFRYTSNQTALAGVKDEIKANLLALKLYKDELHVTFGAQFRILWAIVKMQRYVLPPVILMSPPMLLGLGQMAGRYQWRPLHEGETVQIKMRLVPEHQATTVARLEPDSAFAVEVEALPGGGEIMWRLRVLEAGRHTLRFHVGDDVLEKELVVGEGVRRVSAERPNHRWTAMLLNPTEPAFPEDGPRGAVVRSIEVDYPSTQSWVSGADYWIVYFLVVSMATALLFKRSFKVTF